MKEFRRIIQDKRFLIVIILILVVNGILEYSEMKPNEEGEAYTVSLYGENYSEKFREAREKLEKEYGDLSVEEKVRRLQGIRDEYSNKKSEFWQEAIQQWDGISEMPSIQDYDNTLTEEERIYYSAVGGMLGDYSYILNYNKKIQNILERADKQMKDKGIFEENSFAGRNIVKTKEDFEKIVNVKPQVGKQSSFEHLFNYNTSDFIMITAVLAVVIIVLDERKKGLWEFTYSMPGGRLRLAVSRIFAMAAAAFITAVLVYVQNIIIAGNMGDGYGDLTIPIQSVWMCEKVVLTVSVWQYLLLILFWKVLVLTLVGLFFMGLSLLLKGYMKVFFIGAIAMIAEYMAYDGIDIHSRYSMLKYINIFAWFDSEWCMRNYLNLNIFGRPVSLYTAMCAAVALLLFISAGFVVISGRVRPFAIRAGRLRKLLDKLAVKLKLYSHENMLVTELYKQLIVQKIWIIMALAIIIGAGFYDSKEVGYDYKGTLYQRYMEMLTGSVTEEKINYLENELFVWQEKYDEQARIIENGSRLTNTEMEIAKSKKEQYGISIECVNELIGELDRLYEEKEKGADVKIINMVSYRHLIGEQSEEQNTRDAMILLTISALVAAIALCSENTMNVKGFIKSTKNGRGKFMGCKYAVLFIEELIIFIPVILSTILTINAKYKITWLNASIKSLDFAADFPVDISIATAIVLEYIIMFLIVYMVMAFVMHITSGMKNITAALVLSMAVAVMPAAFYYIGFYGVAPFTVLNELVVSKWMF